MKTILKIMLVAFLCSWVHIAHAQTPQICQEMNDWLKSPDSEDQFVVMVNLPIEEGPGVLYFAHEKNKMLLNHLIPNIQKKDLQSEALPIYLEHDSDFISFFMTYYASMEDYFLNKVVLGDRRLVFETFRETLFLEGHELIHQGKQVVPMLIASTGFNIFEYDQDKNKWVVPAKGDYKYSISEMLVSKRAVYMVHYQSSVTFSDGKGSFHTLSTDSNQWEREGIHQKYHQSIKEQLKNIDQKRYPQTNRPNCKFEF